MIRGVLAAALVVLSLAAGVGRVDAAPEGQVTWGIHVSLVPTWFDPAETTGIVTPFMVMYALHDALVKPLPGNPLAPSLAESWTLSADGLVYEFVLRNGVRFHNGDPVTAEDVKFSFERYRGAASKTFKERVTAVETPSPARVRFRLKEPWPDFLTFYSSATGAGWIVRNTSRRSATTASRRRPSAPAPTASCRSPRVSSSCSRRSTSTGASRRT
jgi:peptide/nickel transport system substrate-binding protein